MFHRNFTKHSKLLLFWSFFLLLPVLAVAQSAQCDAETRRCTALIQMTTEDGSSFGSLGLQLGQINNSEPVLFATLPLGIAVRPGVRVLTHPSAHEVMLAVDTCFPDGCRATAQLTEDELVLLVEADQLSLQFIPFGSKETLSAGLSTSSLMEQLITAGFSIP
jgi:invasion protein IalB